LLKEVVDSIDLSGSCPTTVSVQAQALAHSETQMTPFHQDAEKIRTSLRAKYGKLVTPGDVKKNIQDNWVLSGKKKFRTDLVSERTRLARLILPSQLIENSIDDIATELIRAAESLLQGLGHITESRRSFLVSILQRELFGNSTRAQTIQEEALKALRSLLRKIWEEGGRRPGRKTINEHTADVLAGSASELAETVVDVQTQQMVAFVTEVIEDSVNEPKSLQHQAGGSSTREDDLIDRFYRFLAEGFGEHENTGNRWDWRDEFVEWQRKRRIKRNPYLLSPCEDVESGESMRARAMSKEPVHCSEGAVETSTTNEPMQSGESTVTEGRGLRLKRKAESEVIDLTGD